MNEFDILRGVNLATNSDSSASGFSQIDSEPILAQDDFFWVVWDRYPVSPGHTLIIAKDGSVRFRDLSSEAKMALMKWIDWIVEYLEEHLKPKPQGFNLGLNDGTVAGQTKLQFHFHVIPRYAGDCPDPRGGVRNIIPEKAKYWETQ